MSREESGVTRGEKKTVHSIENQVFTQKGYTLLIIILCCRATDACTMYSVYIYLYIYL